MRNKPKRLQQNTKKRHKNEKNNPGVTGSSRTLRPSVALLLSVLLLIGNMQPVFGLDESGDIDVLEDSDWQVLEDSDWQASYESLSANDYESFSANADGGYTMAFTAPQDMSSAEFDYVNNVYFPQIDFSSGFMLKEIVPNFVILDEHGETVDFYPNGDGGWEWSGSLSAFAVGVYEVTAEKDGVILTGNWEIAAPGIAPMMWGETALPSGDPYDSIRAEMIYKLTNRVIKQVSTSTFFNGSDTPRFGQYLKGTLTVTTTTIKYSEYGINLSGQGFASSQMYILPDQSFTLPSGTTVTLSLNGNKATTQFSAGDYGDWDLTSALLSLSFEYNADDQATYWTSFTYAPQPVLITYAAKTIVYGEDIGVLGNYFVSKRTFDPAMPSGYTVDDAVEQIFLPDALGKNPSEYGVSAAPYEMVRVDLAERMSEYWYAVYDETEQLTLKNSGGLLYVNPCPVINDWTGNGDSRAYDGSTTTQIIDLYGKNGYEKGELPYDQTNPDVKATVTVTYTGADGVTAITYSGVEVDEQLAINMTDIGTYKITVEISDPASNYIWEGENFTYEITAGSDEPKLTVTKQINAADINYAHGTPTFTFLVEGEDSENNHLTYSKTVVFDGVTDTSGTVSKSVTFTLPEGTYTVREADTIRYTADTVTATNGTVVDKTATFVLSGSANEKVTFTNEKVSNSGTSFTAQVTNVISTGQGTDG